MNEMSLWWSLALLGALGSGLFAGLETAIYTINRVRLHVRAHHRLSGAAVLEGLIASPNALIATLLVGVNISNYIMTLGISAIMSHAGLHGWREVVAEIAVVTPILLIFGEVLPKDVFRSHSDVLAYPFARLLWLMRGTLHYLGLIPLIDAVNWLIRRRLHGSEQPAEISHPRRFVTELMKEGVGHGVITPYQSDMIDRVLRINKMRLDDVMMPWTEVTTVRTNQTCEAIWQLADRSPFARVPLVDVVGRPIGMIEVNTVLRYDPAGCPPLESLAQPLPSFTPDMSLHQALIELQRTKAAMALVKEKGKPLGIVTAKDLVEPIVGELGAW
jgi:CBS domain containing-hemolysin-like protein